MAELHTVDRAVWRPDWYPTLVASLPCCSASNALIFFCRVIGGYGFLASGGVTDVVGGKREPMWERGGGWAFFFFFPQCWHGCWSAIVCILLRAKTEHKKFKNHVCGPCSFMGTTVWCWFDLRVATGLLHCSAGSDNKWCGNYISAWFNSLWIGRIGIKLLWCLIMGNSLNADVKLIHDIMTSYCTFWLLLL